MWGRTRDEATAAAGPGSPDRSKGMNSLGQPLNLSAEAEAEPEVDAGTTLHYWGVKSRATAIAYTLGYFAPDAPIRYATEIAYPGTPEFAACESLAHARSASSPPVALLPPYATGALNSALNKLADKSKTMLGQLPCLTDGEVKVGQSGAILRYLIRKYKIQNHGMISNADQAMSEEMIEMGVELLSMGVKAHYPAAGDRTAAMDELFSAGTDKGKNICVVFGILEATIKCATNHHPLRFPINNALTHIRTPHPHARTHERQVDETTDYIH